MQMFKGFLKIQVIKMQSSAIKLHGGHTQEKTKASGECMFRVELLKNILVLSVLN